MIVLMLLQDQYIFIHTALNELLTCGETEIAAGDMKVALRRLDKREGKSSLTRFEEQFNVQQIIVSENFLMLKIPHQKQWFEHSLTNNCVPLVWYGR